MKGCFAAWIALFAAAAWGQDGRQAFHAKSDLVLLDVQVIHNKTTDMPTFWKLLSSARPFDHSTLTTAH
jgi:hypothetical protein